MYPFSQLINEIDKNQIDHENLLKLTNETIENQINKDLKELKSNLKQIIDKLLLKVSTNLNLIYKNSRKNYYFIKDLLSNNLNQTSENEYKKKIIIIKKF